VPLSASQEVSICSFNENAWIGAVPIVASSFRIKGYCKTATRFMYTSLMGVQSLPLASTPSSSASMPLDYDFFEVDNFYKPNAPDNYVQLPRRT